jgi:hypothetical protein
MNGASPGVEEEGPRGVAIVAVRGSASGVAAGATTAATTAIAAAESAVVVPLSLAPRLSQVVIVSHWRWWHNIPRGGVAHQRRGTTHQGGDAAEGGGGRRGRQTPRV